MRSNLWYVYIILNEKGHLYTGITTNLERRFNEHVGSKKGAKFFRSGNPVAILYKKKCLNRSEASKIEAHIKKLKRSDKIYLIETYRLKND